jgi:hypothetical protein
MRTISTPHDTYPPTAAELGPQPVVASPQSPLPLGAFTDRRLSEMRSHDLFFSTNESKMQDSRQTGVDGFEILRVSF